MVIFCWSPAEVKYNIPAIIIIIPDNVATSPAMPVDKLVNNLQKVSVLPKGFIIWTAKTEPEKDNKITEIRLEVPGYDLFAKKQSHSFEAATDIVVEALEIQL